MTSTQHLPTVLPRRLSGADIVAGLLVATAVIVWLLWLTDSALSAWSTRVVAGVVFALGYFGCMTARWRMAEVYGARGHHHAPMSYVVGASLVGAIALLSGLAALVWAAEPMLVVLVTATVTLWAISTARHLMTTSELRRSQP